MGVLRRIAAMSPRKRSGRSTNAAVPTALDDDATSAEASTGGDKTAGAEDSPRNRAFTGAWVFLFSLVCFLFAVGVIPADDSTFGAPRWAVAVILLAPMLCGLGLMAPAAGHPSIGRVLLHAGGLLFVTSTAVFCAWLVLTGRTGTGGTLSVAGIPVPLPAPIARVLNAALVGLATLMFAFMAVAYLAWILETVTGAERRAPSREN